MKLRESLNKSNPDLYARLQVIESKARQILEYSQGGAHLTFTTHGISHISAVESNYDWLLSDQDVNQFNSLEIFCLLCATFFHDALMIPTHAGQEEEARRTHASRADDFLMKNRDLISLTMHEANAIAEVIRGHAVDDFRDLREELVIGSALIDIRKLAACLSMADICHADSSRVPEIVFRHLELDEESAYHWRRHLQISGITRKANRIIMSSIAFSDEGDQAVASYVREIEGQLARIRPYFDSILQPINGIDLQGQRLGSQLDVAMRFQANTKAILDILIEGVYQRQDVFLRELVQNSLDACHLRLAKAMRRSERYSPRVVVSFLSERERIKAVRVDDNGIGMDVGDIQDTLLWIGNSVSKKSDVKKLLVETTGRNLIATFGIGLLSCFKAAKSLTLRSAKEARTAVEATIVSLSEEVHPSACADKSTGTTFIITLRDEVEEDLDLEAAVGHYFRMVQQASVELLSLDYSTASLKYSRDDLFKIATTEAEAVSADPPDVADNSIVFHQLKGDDFLAWLWIPKKGSSGFLASEGKIDILSEGVFVSADQAGEWLPEYLDCVEGLLNFSAGAIDLPVSRDKVVANKKLSLKRAALAEKSMVLVDRLVEATKSPQIADDAALAATLCFKKAAPLEKQRIIRRLDSYQTRFLKRERNISLLDIREMMPEVVYVEYDQGRYVKELATFDGRLLYHKPDDLTQLQAALLRQHDKVVLSAARSDQNNDKIILEFDILKAYFTAHDVQVFDLTQRSDAVSGLMRGKPLPKAVRKALKKEVKFVEVEGLPNKRSWKVGAETWINVSNAQMGAVYDLLQSEVALPYHLDLAEVLFDLLAHSYEDAFQTLLGLILDGRRKRA